MNLGEDPCEGLYLFHFNIIPWSVSSWSSCHSVLQREEASPDESAGLRAEDRRERHLPWVPHPVPAPGLRAGATKRLVALDKLPVQWERLNIILNNTKSVQNKALRSLRCRLLTAGE